MNLRPTKQWQRFVSVIATLLILALMIWVCLFLGTPSHWCADVWFDSVFCGVCDADLLAQLPNVVVRASSMVGASILFKTG